jgi:glycosyltransferase involved in cell wall biosynthesis
VAVRRLAEFAARREIYGATIYQLGNSPPHAPILDLAEQWPGVCVLHDVTLQHLQAWRALHGGAAALATYRGEMRRRYGADGVLAAEAILHNRLPPRPYADFPLCERVAERSRAVIVHSRYAREQLLRRAPGTPVAVAPHGAPLLPPGDRAAARRALDLPEGAFVIAALGNLIPEKRLEVALRAFARALFGLPEALFVIAGAASPHYALDRFVRLHGLAPVVRQLGRVDATTFAALLVAADACVNLRWPTGGETSGSFLRMLAAGRPTLASDAGSFAEAPDDACLKIPLGPDEEDAIAAALLRLARDPAGAAGVGARARAFIAREHRLEHAAAGYRAVLDRVLHGGVLDEDRGGSQGD